MLNYIYNKFFTRVRIIETSYINLVTNYLDNVKVNYINLVTNIFNPFILKLLSKFTLMESLLILDGFISSIFFLKDFFLLKLSIRDSYNNESKYKQDILEKYYKLYKLSFIDRYLLYLIIYTSYNTIGYFNKNLNLNYIIPILLFITLPSIQNCIIYIPILNRFISKYIENKHIFVKYSISKISINFIQNLHPQIEKIVNYHIFIIYKLLTFNFIINIIKNSIFILLLNILRICDSTYYYYKGIKMAYFYKSGYLYNIIPLDNAIYLINIIIKEKRWKELENVEVINGFFTLILNKYGLFAETSSNFITDSNIILLQFLSLWSLVSLLKILNVISSISVYILISLVYIYLLKLSIKNLLTSLILYLLILANFNNLIITVIILINNTIYYCIGELLFFIFNANNIKKVIRMYEVPSKQAIISRVKDEYIII